MKKIRLLPILLTFLFLTALAIRIIYIHQIQRNPLTTYVLESEGIFDQATFTQNAIKIAQGDWLLKQGEALTSAAPVYYYFLGIIYKLFKFSPFAARIIQAFLGTGLCILLYFIAKEIFNKSVGAISAFIASFHGLFIFYNAVLLRATLVTFLNMLLLLLVIRLRKKLTVGHASFAGVVCGLSFLTRENILIFFILIWLWISLRKFPFKKLLKINASLIIGICIVFAPLIIRNYIVTNKFMPTTTKLGEGFWVGNTYDSPGVDLVWSDSYYEMVKKSEGSFTKTGLLFLEEIKKRPQAYFNLYRRKITMFLNGYEVPANLNYYLFREFPTILRSPWFSFTLICPFGLIGMVLALFSKKKVGILYVFIFALSGAVILYHIQARYRIPVVPLFIIFASYTLYWVFQQLKVKMYKRLTFLGIAMIPLFIFVRPDPSYRGYFKNGSLVRYADYTNLANSYINKLGELSIEKKGPPDERFLNDAIKYLKKEIELFPPTPRTAYYRFHLGAAYFQKGQTDEAKREWERALLLNPGFEPAKINLVLLKHKPGEVSEEAIETFENLLEENPRDLNILQSLAQMYLILGRVEDAITLYKKGISYNPEVVELYTLLNKAYKLRGLSKEEIKEKLNLEPLDDLQTGRTEELSVSFKLAMKYISEKKYNEAITQFQETLKKSPNSVSALVNLGVAYRAAGEPEKAITSYERVLELVPEAMPARYNLAMILLSQERFKEAIPHLEKIVDALPELLLAQFHLAGAYEEVGLTDKAIKEYKNFINRSKEKPDRQRQVEQAEDKITVLQWQLKKANQTKPDEFLIKEGYE